MSKAYEESKARKAQEQRRREEEQKKRQKQQAQISESTGKSAAGGALRGVTTSKSAGKANRPAVGSPSYSWLSGKTRTPSQFGQTAYDDSRATPYQQYMHNADAISSADALNRYMQQANDYFNSTYTDRSGGMKLRSSGLLGGVQTANAAGQKVQQYFSSNPQIYSNGKYAEEKANYDRVSSEVADPTLDYRLRARTGDMSVLDEEMDDDTREAVKRNFRQWQYENFYNTSKRETLKNGTVGGTQGLSIWDNVTALRAQALPEVFGYNSDQKSTRALAKGAKNYSELTDMLRAYSRDQLEDDTTTVRTRLGSAQEQRDAAARLNMLVGDGYAQRLQRDWLTDPSVLAEAFDVYEGLQKDSSASYVDALKKAGIYYDGTAEDVNSSYEDYVSTLNAQENYLKEQSKLDTLYKQLDKKFGERIQQAKSRASNPLLSMSRASNQQQGVYTMIAEGYDAAKKAGYIDKAPVSQGIDIISKEYYDGGYDRMTDEEKDNFIALYNDPTQGPGVAFEYLNELKYFTQKKDSDEQEIWISNLAQDGFLGAAAATGISFAAGLANDASSLYVMTDRLINGDQDGKYNEYSPELRYSMIHDVAQGTVAQVIEEAAPNLELAGINIPKAAYNAATSAIESAMRTTLVGHASIFTMGIGAAGSSYRNNLAKVGSVSGYTEDDAYVDSLFDGAVESLTEIFSVEQLLNPTLSPLKNAVRAPLTEMSEEVLSDLVDMGYDTIKYKSRSELSQRYYELLTQGYTNEEAKTMVTQEVAREIAETALVAAISGEMMGGTQAIAAQVENSRVGSEVRKNDNVTGLLDLADTLELPKDVQRMSAEQRSAAEKGEKVSSAKLGRILRESMAKLDESGRQILSESAEKLAKNVLLENGYDGDRVNLNTLAKKVARLAAGQNLTELEMKDVARSDAATKAVQALTERTAKLKEIGDKFGKLDSFMKPREAAQTEISDRLREVSAPQEVTEAFDEAVAKADEAVAKATEEAESDALSAEDERAVRLESFASEYGKNADVMQNAINDGQDVDAYAKAFKVAEVRGEDGQSFDVVKKLSVLSDLTENQVRIAYELGRGIRGARSAQLRQNTNFKGAQVQVGNVDASAIKGHLTSAQQRSIDAARSVAQALGVNIRFFESAANEIGQYTAENGSFDGDTMTISLDIHAGSNSKFNTDYAVMQTLGHELTHFVKGFADSEVFNAYQDFVIGHLSEKMDVDAEVERVTALSAERGVNLSRDGAIEEIIANASGEALMNITQEQITQLAQANPSLAKRIGTRIQEWVKKVLDRIRAAYKAGSVKYEVARQMQDVLTEMSEKWNNALVNAAQNRFGTKNQQQENVQQAETVHTEEPAVKTEALTEETQSAQEEAESKPQPIAGRHIDQRTTDSVKGVDMDLFSSEGEQIQVGFAEAAKILLADLNNTIRGDKTFISDGGADQTVLGQKRMTSALLEEIKDQTGWTWERIGKSLRAFVLAGENGDLVKNTVTNRTMELYLNEMLTEGYTTLEGVKLTPWGEYLDFVQGLEGAKEHAVREVKGAIPFEDYAFADVEEAGTGGREGYGDSEPKYSLRVQDQDTLDFLNNQETVTTYKTMQLVNGKLFPPMAAVVAGQYEDASVLGQWEAAVEHPELVKVDKSGKTKFTLNKGKGKGSLDAAYNPYMHSSNLVLNDQFSGAYARPNLVTVECEVPVSELTSGYRAQHAKDTVGWHSWHTGTVAGALRKANGTERKVLLSRWIKPVRILENSEVARMYSELLDGTGIAVPDNVVPPDLLVELKKAGVPIAESGKVKTAADGDGVKYSIREVDGKNIVWISDNILSLKPKDQKISDFIVDYLTNHVGEMYTIIESGQRVYLGKDLPKEYAWSKYSQRIRSRNQRIYQDKAKAIAGIGETINTATNRRWEQTLHTGNKDAKYGIYKYDSKIAFPVYNEAGDNTGVHAYDVTLVIRNASNGRKYLYDIQNIKNDAFTANTLYSKSRGATERIAQRENIVSEHNIAHSGENVKFSLRDAESDRRYMAAVENGDTETAQRMVDEAAEEAMGKSKIRGKDKKLLPVYHGTRDAFWKFNTGVKGGVNGTNEGYGIYLSDNTEITSQYGERQIRLYADIEKPATSLKKSITSRTLASLIKDTCVREAQRMVDDGDYSKLSDALKDTWISNYVYTYDMSMEQAYRETANEILRANDNDMAIVQEVMSGIGVRSYEEAYDFYHNSLIPVTGIDGFVTQWENQNDGSKSNIILALDSNQLKIADPVTYDDNGNVIPLSQRFNSDSDDIRFQLRYQDDANQISDRELLASALDTVAQNDTERDYLKRYRKYIKELEQKQTQLDDLSARLKDLKADKASAKANRDLIMRMENNAKTLENSIQRTDKRLLDFEATKALKDVMAREKAAWKQTAKARSDARVARLRENNRANTQARVDAAKERARASYERKLEAKLEKAKAAMEKKTDRIVGRLENKLERTEARFEERIAKMKESEKRTEYRKRILEDSAAMREWLTTPTNKAHVPEFLRAPLGDFLKSIDYSSDSLLRGKSETKADAALIDAMERMSRALAQTRTQPDSLSTAEGYMGYLDLPSGFESEFNEMLDRIKGAMESGADVTDTPLNRMTSAQLKTLSDAIRTLNTSVRNMNRLIANGRYQTARDASASTIEELTKLGDRKKTGAVRDALSGWIDWKSATPFYAFQRFGEGGKAIFEGIQDGWDRMAFNVKQVLDFTKSAYTPKQVRQWSRETHSVELSSKKKVQMTTAQLMSLYCLSRREQAMKHLQGGGIRIASFKTKGGTVTQAENYTLSAADISKLTGMLTAEQIEVADKLQAFMSSVCADWGNEVSMQRFGYNAFTEENYFPIETDSNNRAAVDESARENDLFRLLNLSATKAVVQNANNAVVIQDIFDVFAAHAADMAKYNGLALPILDTLKWYNYVEKTRPVNGQFTTQSVQKSLEAAYGRDAQKYVTNFLRDLNGKREGGRNDGLINRMISNYKVAAVGANLRVGFLQITSMPRAAYVISPKYLAVGVARNAFFHNSPIAEMKVGIALWKSLGFYDTNISRNIRDLIKNDAGFFENVRELSMTPAEKGDYWTMGVIYGAVEAEMADRHADVKKNTAKYDQMVNDRMREIIYKTQVVDSTMTRSDIMRGKGLASIASAFMSEPTLTMNMLSESVYEARMKARAGDSKSVAQALVGSRKFGKALAATTVVCALSAVFEAVFSAYRDDDEYETFLEKFNDALVGDLSGADGGWEKFQAIWNGSIMDNFKLWNNIVFVKDISEALAGDSGDAAMWAAGFGDLAKGVQQLYKSILGDGGKPLYGSIYTTLKGVSELSGIPMSAATRDTIGLYNTIAGEMGWKRLQTSNDKPSDAAEAILRAEENGNTMLADRYRRIAGEHGIDEAKLQSAMKSAIQSRFDAGRIEDQRAAELLEDYAGKDAEDAGMQVSRWRYAKDTGLKYGDMKEDYLSGLLDEATALRYLTAEIGADKAAARIDRWNFEQLHGEDADYSSRWKLWEAFEGSGSYDGKTAEQYVREWAKTTDKKNIAAAIAGRYKDEYLRIKGTPAGNRMLEKLLNLYVAAGYEREYEREYIDKKWVK